MPENDQSDLSLRELWDIFAAGDHLSDDSVRRLIASAEEGVDYLDARRATLSKFKTLCDLEQLRGYMRWREHDTAHSKEQDGGH